MLSVEEKLHNMMVATLEENIQFNQRLLVQEKNQRRRKSIEDLIVLLNDRLAKEKI
jgi:hypothetical protein